MIFIDNIETPMFYAELKYDRVVPINDESLRSASGLPPVDDPIRTWGQISFIPPVIFPQEQSMYILYELI